MAKQASGYVKLPAEQIVAVPVSSDAFLIGLGNVGTLQGWKVLKKIKTFAKKVGKSIRKLKVSSIVKVALPVAGVMLAPLALAKVPALISKFGPKVAGLVKGGNTKAQAVRLANGSVKVGLVSAAEADKLKKYVKDPSVPITEALFKQITGQTIAQREAPGAEFKGGDLSLPVTDSGSTVSGEDIPAKLALPIIPLALGALGLMLVAKKRR